MKVFVATLGVAWAVIAFGGDVELKGWKTTNPKCRLMPGRGVDGGTALGMAGEVGRSQKYYTWTSDPVTLASNGVYGMSFFVNRARSGSEVLCRTAHHNLKVASIDPGWREVRTVMRSPVEGAKVSVELSDYNCQAETLFDRPRLVELEPRYRTEAGVTLGRGEVLTGRHYYFMSQDNSVGGGDTRALVGLRRASSGDKFILKEDSEVLHRFDVSGRKFLNGRGMLHVSYVKDAAVEVDVSSDGGAWTRLALVTNAVPCDLVFPKGLFPAREIRLRIKSAAGLKKGALCQIRTVHFDGDVDGEPLYLAGATTYVEKGSDAVFATIDTMGYRVAKPGALLPGSDGDLSVWGVSSGFKIFRDTAVPTVRTEALRIKSAANEAESVQLVVTPKRDIADLRVEAGALTKRKWCVFKDAEIPASAVKVLRVGYVDVRIVTDKVGQAGLWPDPMPPQDGTPLAVRAGENQPMWITVSVPKGTPKGVYRGELKVTADGRILRVPFEVEVFGFDLPDRMTLRTPFGLHPPRIYQYHKAKTDADKDRIREMYIRLLAEHRVTPYYWTRDIFPKVRLADAKDPSGTSVEIDFAEWDREMEMVIDKYHGNVVKLAPEGLGGGNQYNRHPAQICGIKRGDPRYERIMKDYLEKFVRHLREKGWLEYAFVYWFDEPYGQDYDFVSEGMATVRKYAPELRRMITNICVAELMEAVDMWCPTVQHLHVPMEQACRARGDAMWWYICCSPREAPVGEHIDHPGTDMRVWGWQSWGERITGTLVWATEWWTGKTKYPDPEHPQNPYLDPMGWGKSYNPNRITATWCNGDGRYFYPPLACKDAQQAGTVYDEPVSSYRLELFRDGVEDYEYFAMLRRLDASNPLLTVPKSVYGDLFSYTHDPAPMEGHREKLAREIERLVGTQRPDCLANSCVHACGGSELPHNTIESARWCWERGMAVECDCRASKDGVVYLMHDWKLDRFGDVIPKELKGRDVSHDLTWSQLKGLDVGSWRGAAWRGCHPPTFDDFLSQMKGRPTWLAYVHDKGAGPKRIAERTAAAGLVDQVYYTTSDHDEILKWRQYLPDGRSLFWISSWLKDRSESERRRSDVHYREKFAQIRERNFEGINVVCLHVWGNVKDKADRYIPSTPLLREMLGELKAHGIVAQIELHDAEDRDVQAFRDAYDFGFDCFITDHPSVMSSALDKIKANN